MEGLRCRGFRGSGVRGLESLEFGVRDLSVEGFFGLRAWYFRIHTCRLQAGRCGRWGLPAPGRQRAGLYLSINPKPRKTLNPKPWLPQSLEWFLESRTRRSNDQSSLGVYAVFFECYIPLNPGAFFLIPDEASAHLA